MKARTLKKLELIKACRSNLEFLLTEEKLGTAPASVLATALTECIKYEAHQKMEVAWINEVGEHPPGLLKRGTM